MIEKIAVGLSDDWCKEGLINCNETEICRYGLELLISTCLNMLLAVLISVILKPFWAFFPYYLSFIPLRAYAGGFHARTHWFCIIVCGSMYFLSLMVMPVLSEQITAVLILVVIIVSIVIVWMFAPGIAKNKPLTNVEQKKYRKVSLFLVACYAGIGALSLLVGIYKYLFLEMFFCGEATAVFLLLISSIGIIKKK